MAAVTRSSLLGASVCGGSRTVDADAIAVTSCESEAYIQGGCGIVALRARGGDRGRSDLPRTPDLRRTDDAMPSCSICICCPATAAALRSGLPISEDLKQDLRDEAEFRQIRLNQQALRLRGSCGMYLRDAQQCVREQNHELARQFLTQKALMEQRVALMATHWDILESVRVSLQPGERRCMGDILTYRAILAKTGFEFCGPSVRQEGEDETKSVDRKAVETELAGLLESHGNGGAPTIAAIAEPVKALPDVDDGPLV